MTDKASWELRHSLDGLLLSSLFAELMKLEAISISSTSYGSAHAQYSTCRWLVMWECALLGIWKPLPSQHLLSTQL